MERGVNIGGERKEHVSDDVKISGEGNTEKEYSCRRSEQDLEWIFSERNSKNMTTINLDKLGQRGLVDNAFGFGSKKWNPAKPNLILLHL
ncbi:hypothetical protein CEXT_157601 [Caerostris extrusa]|uniref:Uncharacterized protein n=1 Tax=Caerostris extrusa TaxID=172846 RepID=A0AAV4XKA9_CAEEX|nr:hypothetical protein CEXT_157601 [Caerostris extrusa]